MSRPWKPRDDELACVWLMTLDDLADHLGRTAIEVLRRLRALGALPSGSDAAAPAANGVAAAEPGCPLAGLPALLADLPQHDRSLHALPAAAAESIARRVAYQLARGSIELARQALDQGWRDHVRESCPLPTGAALLAEPLASVLENQMLLNALDRAGIATVRDLLQAGDALMIRLRQVGPARLKELCATQRRLLSLARLPSDSQRPRPRTAKSHLHLQEVIE